MNQYGIRVCTTFPSNFDRAECIVCTATIQTKSSLDIEPAYESSSNNDLWYMVEMVTTTVEYINVFCSTDL